MADESPDLITAFRVGSAVRIAVPVRNRNTGAWIDPTEVSDQHFGLTNKKTGAKILGSASLLSAQAAAEQGFDADAVVYLCHAPAAAMTVAGRYYYELRLDDGDDPEPAVYGELELGASAL